MVVALVLVGLLADVVADWLALLCIFTRHTRTPCRAPSTQVVTQRCCVFTMLNPIPSPAPSVSLSLAPSLHHTHIINSCRALMPPHRQTWRAACCQLASASTPTSNSPT